jgi:hypothetical protein
MKNELLSVAEAAERIQSGDVLVVAGSSNLMAQLPTGKWIGGSTAYFVTENGGAVVQDKLFCTTIDDATDATVRVVSPEEVATISKGYKAGGFTVILVPAMTDAHIRFALDSANDADLFDQPLVGWVTGVHLDKLGSEASVVVDGSTGAKLENAAVLLHVELPAGSSVDFDIVNIFSQGEEMSVVFSETGFTARTAKVNGVEVNLAQYLTDNAIDTRLPLVTNYAGSMVNVSVQTVDVADGRVDFYAPIVAGMEYKLAAPQPDYAAAFANSIGEAGVGQYSCNCILNYLYGDLEGKKTGGFTGPVTFGEIAYILLNQTLVKLDVKAA